MQKEEVISYLKTVSLFIIAFIFFVFPLIFLTSTSDAFILPRYFFVVLTTSLLLILWGIRMVIERRIALRSTPFNLPVLLFSGALLLSALLSPNMFDSLYNTVPVLMAALLYFITVNTIDDKNSFNIVFSALTGGAVVSAILTILYFFKIYVLPFPQIQSQYFNTFGSTLQHLTYLLTILLLSSFAFLKKPNVKDLKNNTYLIMQLVSSGIILAGILLIAFQLITLPQKPVLLPYAHGFQVALSSLSRDTARLLFSFLAGSGYGTFATDFARFRLPTFNLEQAIWNYPFTYSSSYLLELVATTGILGLFSYIFLAYKIVKSNVSSLNPLFVSLVVLLGLSFLLPFSYTLVFLIFALLTGYTSFLYISRDERLYDITLSLVALKQGLLSFQETDSPSGVSPRHKKSDSPLLPLSLLLVILLLTGFVSFYSIKYMVSDISFNKSLQRDALNNGQKTYQLQTQAINTYPYRSDYYRVFSQVNFALANSISTSIPKNSSPSAEQQRTITGLLQQSINSARSAITLAPVTASNWENLSQIYRNLINVGQNAEQFSVASLQQAIALDGNNPQLYIQLGGIFYQLGRYDLAENQFRQAVILKPDFANAYYNLGKALEQKNQLSEALQQYQTARELIKNDKKSLASLDKEIKALQEKIGSSESNAKNQVNGTQTPKANTSNQPPLGINQGSATQLPNSGGAPVKLLPPPSNEVKTQPTPLPQATPNPSR